MRYAQIRSLDISNGESVGVALFVQGCHLHCKNCFNAETWDFNGGKEWTLEIEQKFIDLIDKPYIKRVSFLGGEPLANENVNEVLKIINKIRLLFPEKTIWLYTGYKVDDIYKNYFLLSPSARDICNTEPDYIVIEKSKKDELRSKIISQCDVLVDGRYIDSQRDQSLKWKGSKNQRVIDVKKSLQEDKIILYCE